MANDDARTYVQSLRARKGADVETLGDGVEHLAGCVDQLKQSVRELRGERQADADTLKAAIVDLKTQIAALVVESQQLNRQIDRAQAENDREDERLSRRIDGLWSRVDGKLSASQPVETGGAALVKMGLTVCAILSVALILLIVYANPQALEALRIITGGTAAGAPQ